MTFTYSIASLTSDLARVRLRIGDVDSTQALLQDEEINAALAVVGSGNVSAGALASCYLILAKIARETDTNGAGISSSRSQKVQHYTDLIKLLDREATLSIAPTMLTSSTAGDALTDTDFDVSRFSVGMDDRPA